jgi:hypothetical protein
MGSIVDRSQSANENVSALKSKKSPSLRLEKQTIRTLTGAELRLVGGGCYTRHSCYPSSHQSN